MALPAGLILTHLIILLPCIILGAGLFLLKKGTSLHRWLGRIYMTGMGITGILTLFIPSASNPILFNHFGYLHLLSILTIWTIPTALLAARNGNIKGHRSAMIQLYAGGIIIAGLLAIFGTGRYLNQLIF